VTLGDFSDQAEAYHARAGYPAALLRDERIREIELPYLCRCWTAIACG